METDYTEAQVRCALVQISPERPLKSLVSGPTAHRVSQGSPAMEARPLAGIAEAKKQHKGSRIDLRNPLVRLHFGEVGGIGLEPTTSTMSTHGFTAQKRRKSEPFHELRHCRFSMISVQCDGF